MTSSQNPVVSQADATQDAPTLAAPEGLNLLGDASAGGCCGTDGCCSL